MARRDGTGPMGLGPLTGRGLGVILQKRLEAIGKALEKL
ncbi:DUF5320 domain-containing protein [Petrocella sp. FN5]|nr:DUF5320 domain-containing protein [Petrocella sp. FN5]MDF1617480.1 DUF5320 domain-containing protein [Petrocella sp. FN5]